MNIEKLLNKLKFKKIDFFAGVPDSQLKPLCNYLIDTYGISDKHIIAANEGNAVALAAGYHLSTGKIPCVYLQNSGLGNIINPVASLLNDNVYAIPCVFFVGWRGEPGVHDEPQHLFQGNITTKLLETVGIDYEIISKETGEEKLISILKSFERSLSKGKSVAFVVKKGALEYEKSSTYKNNNTLVREDVIKEITNISKEDIIVSTTGKTSRELFEIRENNKQSHKYDFLTVGSMGHSSSIALAVAMNKPNKRVWCIDGDGAALMHMGAMAVIGQSNLENFIHIVNNNGAHESVGGQPTVAANIDMEKIAIGCGYKNVYSVKTKDELISTLKNIVTEKGPILIEIKTAIGSRADLGRPTTTSLDNKVAFMDYLRECN